MPIRFDYDSTLNVVNSYPYEVISISEIKAHFEELAIDNVIQDGFVFSVDFRNVTNIPYSFLEASELVKSYLRLKNVRQIRALIFLSSSSMQYGMARMFQTLLKLKNGSDSVFAVRSEEEVSDIIVSLD